MSDENKRIGKHPDPRARKGERIEIPLNASRTNAVVEDETYGALRADNRVVMRHNIALNLDSFVAATDEFTPRPERRQAALKQVRPPFFSVIIPNFNGRAHLSALFDALCAQTFDDFEVIFFDDASSDDSVTFVEDKYAQRLDLRVIVNRQNVGFVAGVNAAADAARGRLFVLLNNDTEPAPEWMAELARAVCTHPDAAMIASKLLLFDDRNRLHTSGDTLGVDGIPRNRGVWEEDRGQFDLSTDVFGGCGGAVAIRREVWQALGGFDESFWMYLEDADFAFRAQLSGWRAVFAPQARVYHKVSSSGGDTLSSYYVGRNTIWMIAKNMPLGLLWRNLPQVVGAQIQIAVDALRNVRGEAAQQRLRGQLAGVAGLPAQLRKRALIQHRRWADDETIASRLTTK
ncbi:MAG: glycosyltransferase family 2 protein [Caldilineaceae bacterium]